MKLTDEYMNQYYVEDYDKEHWTKEMDQLLNDINNQYSISAPDTLLIHIQNKFIQTFEDFEENTDRYC